MYSPLSRLHVLEEKLLDVVFQDGVLDAIICLTRQRIEGINYFPGNNDINIIDRGTSRWSPARRLLVDIFTLEADKRWMEG